MPTSLVEIVAHKRIEIAEAEKPTMEVVLASGDFRQALEGDDIKLIAEIKPASPSAGVLRSEIRLADILESYNRFASAISVLTDRKFFNGSLELLAEVAANSPRPILCKDFILDPSQIVRARAAGAEAALLIVKILTDVELSTLHSAIESLGMTAVVEIQNEAELERAMRLSPKVLLINNRDLSTFEISLETTKRLAPMISEDVTVISASGIHRRSDIEELLPFCSRFLIGTSLMQSSNLAQKFTELLGNQTRNE